MNDYKKFEDKYWKNFEQSLEFRHRAAADFIKSGEIIDIGCGDGLFLGLLKKNGLKAKGIDLSDEAVETARAKGLDVSQADILSNKLPYSDNSFDYVVALDVLEHTFVPDEFLKEMKRISKKYIIIGVPNFSSLPSRLQVLRGLVPENNTPRKGHAYWFNYKVLNDLLKKSDLKIVSYRVNSFYGHIPFFGMFLEKLAKKNPNLFALSFVVFIEK